MNYAGSTSGPLQITVSQATVTGAITYSPNPAVAGQPEKLIMTLTGTGSTPTGTVTFTDGSTPLGTATVIAGVATLTGQLFTSGSHSITASYGGDTNNGKTSASLTLVVGTSTPAVVSTFVAVALGRRCAVHADREGDDGKRHDADRHGDLLFRRNRDSVRHREPSLLGCSHALGLDPRGGIAPVEGGLQRRHLQRHRDVTRDHPGGPAGDDDHYADRKRHERAAGAGVTFTATVASSTGAIPTGSVQFLDGTTVLATVPLPAGSGSVGFTTSSALSLDSTLSRPSIRAIPTMRPAPPTP